MTERKVEDYCDLIVRMKPALSSKRYVVLKLYDGYNKTSVASYEPSDVDIFVGSDVLTVYDILKSLRKAFPDREIGVVVKKTFLSPNKTLLISGYAVEVDLYTEVAISPLLRLDSVPDNIDFRSVPWCKDVRVPVFESSFDVLHIIAHAVRHKSIRGIEIFSLIERLNNFSITDIKKFIYYVKKANMEEAILLVLELVMYCTKHCLKLEVSNYTQYILNIQRLIEIFRKSLSNQRSLIYMLAKIFLLYNLRPCSRNVNLLPVLTLSTFSSLKSVLSTRSRSSLIQLLRMVLLYHIYELVIAVFHKLRILKN